MSKSKSAATSDKPGAKSSGSDARHPKDTSNKAARETIESIAVAVILAFLFRAFVAEAFVIPTGSMAPTLQGRHMDVTCAKCGCPYRAGASVENDGAGEVRATTCPICRFVMELDKAHNPNQRSFNGDRILVSKFAYEIGDPQRWDVIVFKYPGNAKQNYIKRLIGLPNETIRIRHGDIYRRANTASDDEPGAFQIARKPPYKLRAMLQIVDNTQYRAQDLVQFGWPERWQDWAAPDAASATWRPVEKGSGFETVGPPTGEAWLRYRHLVPWDDDWRDIADGKPPQRLVAGEVTGQLITDHYAYNQDVKYRFQPNDSDRLRSQGLHWVGDLAVECEDLQVKGDRGQVLLDLVEGGVHYTCRIDVATGEAVLAIQGGQQKFVGESGAELQHPKAITKLRGPGSYDVRFANCDDQVLLWVDGCVVKFDGPTTYVPDPHARPRWSADDPGDLEPVGIGAQGVELRVAQLQVLRDVYYVATSYKTGSDYSRSTAEDDYQDRRNSENGVYFDVEQEWKHWAATRSARGQEGQEVSFDEWEWVLMIRTVLANPELWESTTLFDARRDVTFVIGEDQFVPLGDNSPASKDARLWTQAWMVEERMIEDPPPYVERDLLTGKALMIYWPHHWRRPIPLWPNFRRMGLIR